MRISTQTSIFIKSTREAVWSYVTNATTLPAYFTGWGPIPGVKEIKVFGAGEAQQGMRQKATTEDGRTIEEIYTAVRKPEYFEYKMISGLGQPYDMFIKGVSANWTFTEQENGTSIVWQYHFNFRSALFYPVGLLLVKFLYKNAMKTALKNLKTKLES